MSRPSYHARSPSNLQTAPIDKNLLSDTTPPCSDPGGGGPTTSPPGDSSARDDTQEIAARSEGHHPSTCITTGGHHSQHPANNNNAKDTGGGGGGSSSSCSSSSQTSPVSSSGVSMSEDPEERTTGDVAAPYGKGSSSGSGSSSADDTGVHSPSSSCCTTTSSSTLEPPPPGPTGGQGSSGGGEKEPDTLSQSSSIGSIWSGKGDWSEGDGGGRGREGGEDDEGRGEQREETVRKGGGGIDVERTGAAGIDVNEGRGEKGVDLEEKGSGRVKISSVEKLPYKHANKIDDTSKTKSYTDTCKDNHTPTVVLPETDPTDRHHNDGQLKASNLQCIISASPGVNGSHPVCLGGDVNGRCTEKRDSSCLHVPNSSTSSSCSSGGTTNISSCATTSRSMKIPHPHHHHHHHQRLNDPTSRYNHVSSNKLFPAATGVPANNCLPASSTDKRPTGLDLAGTSDFSDTSALLACDELAVVRALGECGGGGGGGGGGVGCEDENWRRRGGRGRIRGVAGAVAAVRESYHHQHHHVDGHGRPCCVAVESNDSMHRTQTHYQAGESHVWTTANSGLNITNTHNRGTLHCTDCAAKSKLPNKLRSVTNSLPTTTTSTSTTIASAIIKKYRTLKAAKIASQNPRGGERKGRCASGTTTGGTHRRQSIETVMEFDEVFHGADGGLDSPMSDCTSLFSLGSEGDACLQEVIDCLGEGYGSNVDSSSVESSPVHVSGTGRWDGCRGKTSSGTRGTKSRKIKHLPNMSHTEYQELVQQCDPASTGNNPENMSVGSREQFVVQVEGQPLSPEDEQGSIIPQHRPSHTIAESSFTEVKKGQLTCPHNIIIPPSSIQTSNSTSNSLSSSCESDPVLIHGSMDVTNQQPDLNENMPLGSNIDPRINPKSSVCVNNSELSNSNEGLRYRSSNSSSEHSSPANTSATFAQRPDVLHFAKTNSPNTSVSPIGQRMSNFQSTCVQARTTLSPTILSSTNLGCTTNETPIGVVPQIASMHRCCTCGQTIPLGDHDSGDITNGNITSGHSENNGVYCENTGINGNKEITVVDVHVSSEENTVTVSSELGKKEVDYPRTRKKDLSQMTPAERFNCIEELQKEKAEFQSKNQSLAPPLHDNLRYHAFFLYHNNDRDWVLNVMEKLESPTLGFKCCCHERDLDCSLSLPQAVLYGMKNSVKTVVVLSPDFISSTWSSCEVVVSEMDIMAIQRDLLLVMLQECDMPNLVTDLPYIDATKRDWWTKLLATLALPDDTPMTEETVLSMSSSLVGLNPGLQSGHLLHSIKSKCLCCGRELIDPSEVPDELIAHGVQIPPEEYCHAIRQLMAETKFRCHIWCYNMPVAMVFFTLFLGLCLAVIPVIETKYMFSGTGNKVVRHEQKLSTQRHVASALGQGHFLADSDLTHPSLPTPNSKGLSIKPTARQTGLEYVHGAVVWLCVLTVYMLCTHLARRKMKEQTYRRLSEVNTVFIKYNLLAGVENLGLADCNKYYLHFFYFELGPCLAYLQELVDNLEDVSPSYTNQAYLQELLVNLEECTPCYTNSGMDTEVNIEDTEDGEGCNQDNNTSDCNNMLNHNNITNVSMQTHAEDLLLDHSGEYINMLITKKLDRPRKQRHVKGAYCLCQFIEQRVYKMVV